MTAGRRTGEIRKWSILCCFFYCCVSQFFALIFVKILAVIVSLKGSDADCLDGYSCRFEYYVGVKGEDDMFIFVDDACDEFCEFDHKLSFPEGVLAVGVQ